MKSIILLALFALAANAAFNITAFGIGEAQQYGLTAEQIEQDAVPCFNALQTSFDNLVQLFETKDLVTILSGFSALYEQFQTDAENTCHPYAVDAGTYIYENAPNHAANLTETMKQNFEKYYAQVIQQVAIEINDIIAGNFEAAGAAKGVSSQILFGIVTPQTLPVPQFNYSLYVPFNVEEFSTEYFTALFSAIGSNQSISGSQISACLSEIITFTTNIESLIGNFSSYTFADKVVGISSFFEESGETLESCEYYAEIFAPISGPLFEAFKANPVSFVLNVANNIAMNAPEFVQSAQQEEVYILEGEYASAGELKGERFNQIFGFAGF